MLFLANMLTPSDPHPWENKRGAGPASRFPNSYPLIQKRQWAWDQRHKVVHKPVEKQTIPRLLFSKGAVMLSSQETSVSNSLQIVQWPQQSSIKLLSHFTCLREMSTATPHEGRLGLSKGVHLWSTRPALVPWTPPLSKSTLIMIMTYGILITEPFQQTPGGESWEGIDLALSCPWVYSIKVDSTKWGTRVKMTQNTECPKPGNMAPHS